jgi:hypothetical protein
LQFTAPDDNSGVSPLSPSGRSSTLDLRRSITDLAAGLGLVIKTRV